MSTTSTYLLSRSKFASLRLTSQHFLWQDLFGWNVHPSILKEVAPHSEELKLNEVKRSTIDSVVDRPSQNLTIADVGCGNGLWIVQEAHSTRYPDNTQFYGLDISAKQFPSTDAVSPNIHFAVLDASDASRIPPEYHSFFDVINVRLLMGAVPSPTPVKFLDAFLTMLKPGGYLHWGEVDVHSPQAISNTDPTQDPAECKWKSYIQKMVAAQRPQSNIPMNWGPTLPKLFKDHGMTDVVEARPGRPRREMMKIWTDNEFAVTMEIALSLGVGQDVLTEIEEGWTAGEWDFAYEVRIAVGRKAK